MTARIRRMKVFFGYPVVVPSSTKPLPAGNYEVAWSQKVTDGRCSADLPRPSTCVQLAGPSDSSDLSRSVTITWEDLGRALGQDAAMRRRSASLALNSALLDPIVQTLMQRDGLSEEDLRRGAASAVTHIADCQRAQGTDQATAIIKALDSFDE
jgi:hypothetical protein